MDYVIVYSPEGDWEILFENGLEIDSGHSLSVSNVLKILTGKTIRSLEEYEVTEAEILCDCAYDKTLNSLKPYLIKY